MKKSQASILLLSIVAAATLSACGGGGDSLSPGTLSSAPASTASQGAGKYAGAWTTACFLNTNGVRQGSSQGPDVYQTRTFTFVPADATTPGAIAAIANQTNDSAPSAPIKTTLHKAECHSPRRGRQRWRLMQVVPYVFLKWTLLA